MEQVVPIHTMMIHKVSRNTAVPVHTMVAHKVSRNVAVPMHTMVAHRAEIQLSLCIPWWHTE